MSNGPRIDINVPAHDTCATMFAFDLANMMGFTLAHIPIGNIRLNFFPGTYVHCARQELAEASLERGSDFVLWIDSDMRFPKDALGRLLARLEIDGLDMVGINYSTRKMPLEFVAIKERTQSTDKGSRLWTGPDSTGVEEVDAVGGGLVLMRTSILAALPDPKGPDGPWFFFRWLPNLGRQMGEDVLFCEKVREAGYKIHADHDLSKQCAHIAAGVEYTPAHVWALADASDSDMAEGAALAEALGA